MPAPLKSRRIFLKQFLLLSILRQNGAAYAPPRNRKILHLTPSSYYDVPHPFHTKPCKRCRILSETSLSLGSKSMETSETEEGSSNYKLAQDSSELFDIYPPPPSTSQHNAIITSDWGTSYFPSPKPTGKVKERGLVHVEGDWHRSVQVWIVEADTNQSEKVRVLLQRRSPYKDTHPNLLDVSCAGHVNAGDDILDTTMREMNEELGGNGMIQGMYSLEDIERSKAFTITSVIEGETKKYGKFICREYQDVFLLRWAGNAPLKTKLFAPIVQEEVSGFDIMDGRKLIERMRMGDEELVPRSVEYQDALAKAIGLL